MKKILSILFLLCQLAFVAGAQEGSWSGKLDTGNRKLTLVFHLDGDEPSMDCPDQAAMGIPIKVERNATGGISIKIPMLGASYEGMWMLKQIAGTFARRIVCYSEPGKMEYRGDQCGVIKFGSRIDLFVPLEAEVKVKVGDKVRAVESILAVLPD